MGFLTAEARGSLHRFCSSLALPAISGVLGGLVLLIAEPHFRPPPPCVQPALTKPAPEVATGPCLGCRCKRPLGEIKKGDLP